MGRYVGAGKYAIATPLTVAGFISMYIYGGLFISAMSALPQLFAGNFMDAFMTYFLSEALPPTSIGDVVFQAALGTGAATFKWFLAMG
jgi:hypothetical protein